LPALVPALVPTLVPTLVPALVPALALAPSLRPAARMPDRQKPATLQAKRESTFESQSRPRTINRLPNDTQRASNGRRRRGTAKHGCDMGP
jgi:hypothetical protein